MSDRYDVVLYGVTGFTGRQTAEWFDANAPDGLRWAIAARNPWKLAAVADGLKSNPDQIVADSTDAASIDAMVAQARVLLTTAGPFAKYGTPVVDACVRHKTHYVDITGETPWVADLIEAYHEQAAADGTRIVPFCGFDSIPSDLGTLMVVDWLRETYGQPTKNVRTGFSVTGGLNGGTLDSALTMATAGENKRLAHTQLLNPEAFRTKEERERSRDFASVAWDDDLQRWTAPFFMATVNTRVVRRSNALRHLWDDDTAYGDTFTYNECAEFRTRGKAWSLAAGSLVGVLLISNRLGRSLAKRFGPDPGEGPSEETMDGGYTRARIAATADDGRKALGTVSYPGDPGNRATVLMLCCSALTLALDGDTLPGGPSRGGVLTPATALGQPAIRRMRDAGMTWEVEAAD